MRQLIVKCPIVLLLLLQSCIQTNDDIKNQLLRIEEMIVEEPDSALVSLQRIDTTLLYSEESKALFALLYTQAEDKNYVDTSDDKRIRVAVEHYAHSHDKYHKMLSYYYSARVQFNNKAYSNSITELLKAESVALDLEDNFYLGLIYRQFSDIYAQIYNSVEGLNYALRSYNHFQASGDTNYCDWALWDVGRAYYNCEEYQSSICYANQIIDLGRSRNDDLLTIEGIRLAGMSYMANGQYDKAISIYHQILSNYPTYATTDDYQYLCLSYIENGDIDSANRIIGHIDTTEDTLQWLSYAIRKKHGDNTSALEALELAYQNQDKIIRTIVNQNVTEAVSKYHEYEHIVQAKDLKFEKTTKIISILISIIVIILGSIIAHLRIKTQKRETESNMLLASNLRNILQTKETEAQTLQDCLNKHITDNAQETLELQKAINNLFEQRFATIDMLSNAYYTYQGTANEKHKIYTEVMKLVSGFGSDNKTIKELENFINTYKNNIIVDFKADFPDIKESDYLLYLYLVAGFSSRAISIFIGEKLAVVYNRKSRLRHKIDKSNIHNKSKYLAHIS